MYQKIPHKKLKIKSYSNNIKKKIHKMSLKNLKLNFISIELRRNWRHQSLQYKGEVKGNGCYIG